MGTLLSIVGYLAIVVIVLFGVSTFLTRGAGRNRHIYGADNFTREGVQKRIEVDFPLDQQAAARELLERLGPLGDTVGFAGQAQFGALILAEGSIERLTSASNPQLHDPRDIIVKAGIG